jgi:hypothetical protein
LLEPSTLPFRSNTTPYVSMVTAAIHPSEYTPMGYCSGSDVWNVGQ